MYAVALAVNACADALATRGAELAEQDLSRGSKVKAVDAKARLARERNLRIRKHIVEHFGHEKGGDGEEHWKKQQHRRKKNDVRRKRPRPDVCETEAEEDTQNSSTIAQKPRNAVHASSHEPMPNTMQQEEVDFGGPLHKLCSYAGGR